MKYRLRDKVIILKGPPDKVGQTGKITILMVNGAMVRLDQGGFTPVKFEHLKLVKKNECN